MPSVEFNFEKYKQDEEQRLDPQYKLTKEQRKYMCDNGHELKALGIPWFGITCTICFRPMPANTCMYSCNECKVDKCQNCFHNLESHRSIPRAADCPKCDAEMEWTDYNEGIYQTGWYCNTENCAAKKKTHGAWRWFCIECSYDLCIRCHRPVDDSWKTKETPQTLEIGHKFLRKCQNYQWEDALKDLGENPGLINLTFDGGWSALHFACRNARTDVVRHMLDQSADATYVASDGKTPFDLAKESDVNLLMLSSGYLMPARIVFSHYDVNGSGSLDLHELCWVLKTIVPKLTDEDIKGLFLDCDADGSGEVDYGEFCAWLYRGSGRGIASYILATADRLANPELEHLKPSEVKAMKKTLKRVSGQTGFLEAQKRTQEKMEIFSVRLEVDIEDIVNGDNFRRVEVDGRAVQSGRPPKRLGACEDHIREMAPHLEGLKLVEDMLECIEKLAEEQVETEMSAMIDNKQMLFAIIIYTFDLALIGRKKVSSKKNNFRWIFSRKLRQRDPEFMQICHSYYYYLMTGLSRMPLAAGVVYQGIHKENVDRALEVLKVGTIHIWPTTTSAGRLLNYMAEYQDEGLVLLIHLLPERSQATDLSKITAIHNTDEVILWPNFRVKVKKEPQQKRGFNVIVMEEVYPDTALILRAEDFDD